MVLLNVNQNGASKMKILITGATGFVGSHLVFTLLRHGHEVAILKRKDSGLRGLISVQAKIQIFISDTYNDISLAVKDFSPNVVIHLAAMYINQHKPEHIFELVNSNILFGTHVLEAMMENGVINFLNIGTRWQHLKNKRYNPANLYSATKEAFKDILVYYGTKGIKHKTLELGDTYGSGDTRKKIMELLITACQKNERIDLTPGEQVLDLTFVDDICRFIVSKVDSTGFFDNKTVSLSGTAIKLRDLGTTIEREFKTEGLFNWGGKAYRENEAMEPPLYYKKVQFGLNSLEPYIKNIIDGSI
jgi:nucleoside-diphosphate-sugar epimerase